MMQIQSILEFESDEFFSISQNFNCCYTETKEFFDWPNSFINSLIDVDFKNISSFSSTVYIIIIMIQSCTSELTPNISKVCVEGLNFFINTINCQNLNSISKNCNKFIAIPIEKENLIYNLFIWSSIKTLTSLYIPNNHHIFILEAALRSQELAIMGESQTCDSSFV